MKILLNYSPASIYWIATQSEIITSAISRSIRELLERTSARLPYLIAAILVLLIFWLLTKAFRASFERATRRSKMDSQLRLLASRLISVSMTITGLLTAISVVVDSFSFGQVIAGLGFSSFIVGFATKDILNNFLSGVLILWQRPFRLGDHLFVGSNQGMVEDIGFRATSLRKDDGEIILIPNGEMYSSALTIRGAGKRRRMSLKITVGYDQDVELAKEISLAAARGTNGVLSSPEANVYLTEFTVNGAVITIQFWIDPNENSPLDVYDRVAIESLRRLKSAGIIIYCSNK
ncbi:MAG: mechanosensitive ion channel family protein [Acidobacteriota bacterium]|jgi:small conductance mechanosensitive channel